MAVATTPARRPRSTATPGTVKATAVTVMARRTTPTAQGFRSGCPMATRTTTTPAVPIARRTTGVRTTRGHRITTRVRTTTTATEAVPTTAAGRSVRRSPTTASRRRSIARPGATWNGCAVASTAKARRRRASRAPARSMPAVGRWSAARSVRDRAAGSAPSRRRRAIARRQPGCPAWVGATAANVRWRHVPPGAARARPSAALRGRMPRARGRAGVRRTTQSSPEKSLAFGLSLVAI